MNDTNNNNNQNGTKGKLMSRFVFLHQKHNGTQTKSNQAKKSEDKKHKTISELDERTTEEEKALLKYNMGKHLVYNKETPLNFRNIIYKYWVRVSVVILAAIIFNFGVQVFLDRSDTIPSGLTGIPTLLQLIFPSIRPFFALIYLAVNLPLFIIFWKKIKRSFLVLTLLFMIAQIGINLIFSAEPVHSFLEQIFNLVPNWSKSNIEVTWPILVYGSLGAFFIAISIALTWKVGGSTGGTDIIVYYFTTKTKKNVAWIMSITSFATALVFLIIFGFVKPHPVVEEMRTVIGMREVSTILYILLVNVVVNFLYPKYKKVFVSISCSDPTNVLAYFKLIKYWHGYQITTLNSGYTGATIYKIETVMLILETKNILSDLKLVDPGLFISLTKVRAVQGNFNTNFVDI